MKGHITFLLLTIRKYSDREIASRNIQVVVYLSKECFCKGISQIYKQDIFRR
jgi:hypothetical protein